VTGEVRTVGVRNGKVLCLAGGGYRAALFHLGALTRLNELGLLAGTETIGAAGGGSVLAALLATRVPWPLRGPFGEWSEMVAEPLREIARSELRSGPLLGHPVEGPASGVGLEDRFARQLVIGEQPSGSRLRLVFGGAGVTLGEMSAQGGGESSGLRWELGACCEGGYDAALVEEAIAAVRTDLDAFGEGEQAVLENHGYLLADAALRANGGRGGPSAKPPHRHWMDEGRVRQALMASSRRMRRGRWRERAG
jgi:hypothetical protein